MFDRKNLKVLLIVGIITICILFGFLGIILSLTWKPTLLDKYSFSDLEKTVIAAELNIPSEQISIDKMHYSHAKDSFFLISITSDSLDILSAYEYQGLDHYTNKPCYHYNNIVCTIDSENPYKLSFSIHDWNKNLYNLLK